MQTFVQQVKKKADGLMTPVVSLDPGNGYLKALLPTPQGHKPYCIPNWIVEIPEWQEFNSTPETLVVVLQEANGEYIRYAIGEEAKFLGGRPMVELGKSAYLHVVTKAILQFISDPVVDLNILVADSRQHEWGDAIVNIKMTCPEVGRVNLSSEGTPPWRWMNQNNLWAYPELPNGVLDIGCGETTCRLVSPRGTVDMANEITVKGMIDLAERIGSALKSQGIQFTANPGRILDAIEKGDFIYEDHGRSFYFQPIYQKELDKWQKDMAQRIIQRWQTAGQKFGQILICGGGAYLCKKLEEKFPGRFIVASNKQVDNFAQMINAYAMAATH